MGDQWPIAQCAGERQGLLEGLDEAQELKDCGKSHHRAGQQYMPRARARVTSHPGPHLRAVSAPNMEGDRLGAVNPDPGSSQDPGWPKNNIRNPGNQEGSQEEELIGGAGSHQDLGEVVNLSRVRHT